MTLTGGIRKFVLMAHITSSVGWLGAVVSFLALALVGLMSTEDQTVRAAYVAMEVIAWFAIVPLAIASLVTGIVQSLGTTWGLFRHYWIITKFVITIVATLLLLLHTRPIGILAGAAREMAMVIGNYRGLQLQLVGDAVAAIVLLLAATVLSVYKPWGLTAYGRRKQSERVRARPEVADELAAEAVVKAVREPARLRPRWVYVVGIHAAGLALLFMLLHLTGTALPGH